MSYRVRPGKSVDLNADPLPLGTPGSCIEFEFDDSDGSAQDLRPDVGAFTYGAPRQQIMLKVVAEDDGIAHVAFGDTALPDVDDTDAPFQQSDGWCGPFQLQSGDVRFGCIGDSGVTGTLWILFTGDGQD